MGRTLGGLSPFFGGDLGPIKQNVAGAEAYLFAKFHLDPSSRLAYLYTKWRLNPPSHLAATDMGRKLGPVLLWGGELALHLIQRGQGRGLPEFRVSC